MTKKILRESNQHKVNNNIYFRHFAWSANVGSFASLAGVAVGSFANSKPI
jgi:hypothetical protein